MLTFQEVNAFSLCVRLALCLLSIIINTVVIIAQIRLKTAEYSELIPCLLLTMFSFFNSLSVFVITLTHFDNRSLLLITFHFIFGTTAYILVIMTAFDRWAASSMDPANYRRRSTKFTMLACFVIVMAATTLYGYIICPLYLGDENYVLLTVALPLISFVAIGAVYLRVYYSMTSAQLKLNLSNENFVILNVQSYVLMKAFAWIFVICVLSSLPLKLVLTISFFEMGQLHLLDPTAQLPSHLLNIRILPDIFKPIIVAYCVLKKFHFWKPERDHPSDENHETQNSNDDDVTSVVEKVSETESNMDIYGYDNPYFEIAETHV